MHVICYDCTEFRDEILLRGGENVKPEKILIFLKSVKW